MVVKLVGSIIVLLKVIVILKKINLIRRKICYFWKFLWLLVIDVIKNNLIVV